MSLEAQAAERIFFQFAEAVNGKGFVVDGNGQPSQDAPPRESADSNAANWPKLQPAAFHGVAGELAKRIEPHTESDTAALLFQTLVGFGNLLGRVPYFRADGATHYTNLFLVLVGETAKSRKGTSLAHVLQVLRLVDEQWATESVQSGLATGEGLTWAIRDPIFRTEKSKGVVTEYEQVLVDAGIPDKRLLAVATEFSAVLKVMGRDGNTLSDTIRQAWDDGNLRIMNKTSPAKATGAHISIIGHSTDVELKRYLNPTEAGNGFANRFLFVRVKRSKCLPDGGQINTVDFTQILRCLTEAVTQARQTGEVRRDAKASELWHAVYPALSAGKPGLLGSITARAEAQAMRLACIYALLDRCSEVREQHLRAALAAWQYCAESAASIFGTATGDKVVDKILEALKGQPEGITRNQIRELFQRNLNAESIQTALDLLLRFGKARFVKEETGAKRRPERWFAT